jgi:hypothetical protein
VLICHRIFILEGLLTVLVSFWFYFLLPSFPEEVKWLREDERAYVKARLQLDQGPSAVERPIKIGDVGRVFKDLKVVVGGFMYLGLIVRTPRCVLSKLLISVRYLRMDMHTSALALFRAMATAPSRPSSTACPPGQRPLDLL